MQSNTELLPDFWYVAAPSGTLARGEKLPITLLGEPLLLLRDHAGTVSALRDFCPHRGIPLRYGRFDGHEIECCYHGWRFGMDGCCTAIPSLLEGDTTDTRKIKTGRYPVQEQDGLIWIFAGQPGEPPPPPPAMPIVLPRGFAHVTSTIFPCPIDHAVIGLMDPAHGPFVHRSWWWRTPKSIHAKAKHFEPRPHGFAMVSHKPSSNSRAYKILGGDRTTEIQFRLPGLRSEHITIGRHHVLLLTALTPIDATTTQLHQFAFTTMPLIRLLFPLLKRFGRAFIAQDIDVVNKQQEGLRGDHPSLMLMGDADAQALWYYRLKKEALAARAEARDFENPLRARTLRWRS
ncbi:MAG: aromatic ring-hydroxylating dioxygenase subunit alpha [Alphaproteobacteria bacterium]|nr:aromatic ring-hydroxylating dioxygenase subunit alpha [Alphaproteobacteria bacterium]